MQWRGFANAFRSLLRLFGSIAISVRVELRARDVPEPDSEPVVGEGSGGTGTGGASTSATTSSGAGLGGGFSGVCSFAGQWPHREEEFTDTGKLFIEKIWNQLFKVYYWVNLRTR